MKPILLAACLTLAACASPAPVIDSSGKDQACVSKTCSPDYEQCMGEPTLMPIRKHRDCAKILNYCVRACPARAELSKTKAR